ncbi:carbohydrate sulfotransferase 11-like [Macrobrachium rosenbergii]|uniref:carbohydrate sulfotransferase 11-like n=1 Tax=Macrobrachium rosenbergii TaxID=79674 RepID=UPI0034D6DC58
MSSSVRSFAMAGEMTHSFIFSSSMSAKTLRKFCLFVFLVIPMAIISLNISQTGYSGETVSRLKIPQVPSGGRRQLAGYSPHGVVYKDTRWAADIERVFYTSINMTTMEALLLRRRQLVLDKCKKVLTLSEQTQPINSKEFLISEKYKLIWCNVFKAASSSWIYNFMLMAGYSDEEMRKQNASPIEFARKKYKRPSVEELNSFLEREDFSSFIIVRDPFERLLSAYRDKIESQLQAFYRPLRCHIQKTYGSHRGILRDCRPSFSEFVNYIIDEHVSGKAPNEHWAPYYTFCSPCQTKFDYILHFETLDHDEAFLVNTIKGLSSVVQPHKLHSSHTEYATATAFYFGQLTEGQKKQLYSIYEKDFEIFDYDAKIYL